MIRGAIDFADAKRVSGWLFSDVIDLRGQTVLAFLGDRCVGAGAVDVFRQDLADAGIGGGNVGFNFGVTVAPDDVQAIVVRLEGSDLSLIQPKARVVAADTSADGEVTGSSEREPDEASLDAVLQKFG